MFVKGHKPAKGVKKGGKSKEHVIRTADGGQKKVKLTRALAVRLLCVECLGFEGDPKDCTSPLCPVYPFRGGTRLSRLGD
jgi:hypothetical protein